MSVASYDNEFQAQSIMIDTLSLEEAIQMLLQQQSLNQQALIDGLTNSLAGVEGFDPCPLHLQWSCGCPLTYQGYDYATVLIGEQCWFAENLRSENYENGDAINLALALLRGITPPGAVAVMGKMRAAIISLQTLTPATSPIPERIRRLYNWYAVIDARGLCPSGWHVPTDAEWTILADHLGESLWLEPNENELRVEWWRQGTNRAVFQVCRAASVATMDYPSTKLETGAIGGVPRPLAPPTH